MLDINIKKKYNHFTLDCSMKVNQGYITGIIGQNGAGKTTTLKAILNLISIDEGYIHLIMINLLMKINKKLVLFYLIVVFVNVLKLVILFLYWKIYIKILIKMSL